MPAEQIVSAIDFRYIDDALTPEEALDLLRGRESGLTSRLETLRDQGYPAYTTSAGWIGYATRD